MHLYAFNIEEEMTKHFFPYNFSALLFFLEDSWSNYIRHIGKISKLYIRFVAKQLETM